MVYPMTTTEVPHSHSSTPFTLTPILSDQELFQLMGIVRNSSHVVICGHLGPDGDAVGSSLGWAEYLQKLGKQVTVIMPNPFPDFLYWLPGAKQVLFLTQHQERVISAIQQADLICCLDLNAIGRTQDLAPYLLKSKARRIIIDHHLNPDTQNTDMVISHPEMCSTSEIVCRLILRLGGFDDMSRAAASAIYCGMMTDTGGFTYASNNPEIYMIISLLLTKGIDKDKIYRNVFYSYSEHRLRMMGYILHEKLTFYADCKASIFTISRQELKDFHFIRGDAEGWVNLPLQVRGMRLSISLREDTEKDVIRVSLRSVDDFPCHKMAEEFFHGGGHRNASGGELPFPMEEALKTAERAIEAYKELL